MGIGSVGEVVCFGVCLCDQDVPFYNKILDAIGCSFYEKEVIDRIGSIDMFEIGLYSSMEFLSDGIFVLYKCGLLR